MLDGAALSYFDDDGHKKGSINLCTAVSVRNSTCETAKGHEIEIETPARTTIHSSLVYTTILCGCEWWLRC